MEGKDLAYWLADKIPAHGDYAKQAAGVLRKQADEIERLRIALDAKTKAGNSPVPLQAPVGREEE